MLKKIILCAVLLIGLAVCASAQSLGYDIPEGFENVVSNTFDDNVLPSNYISNAGKFYVDNGWLMRPNTTKDKINIYRTDGSQLLLDSFVMEFRAKTTANFGDSSQIVRIGLFSSPADESGTLSFALKPNQIIYTNAGKSTTVQLSSISGLQSWLDNGVIVTGQPFDIKFVVIGSSASLYMKPAESEQYFLVLSNNEVVGSVIKGMPGILTQWYGNMRFDEIHIHELPPFIAQLSDTVNPLEVPASGSVKVDFNLKVDTALLHDDSIVLSYNGQPVEDYQISVVDEKSVEISFDGLEYNTYYDILISSALKDLYGRQLSDGNSLRFLTEKKPPSVEVSDLIFSKNGTAIQVLSDGKIKVLAQITNTEEKMIDVFMLVTLCEGNEKNYVVKDMALAKTNLSGESKTVECEIEVGSTQGQFVKVYFLDEFECAKLYTEPVLFDANGVSKESVNTSTDQVDRDDVSAQINADTGDVNIVCNALADGKESFVIFVVKPNASLYNVNPSNVKSIIYHVNSQILSADTSFDYTINIPKTKDGIDMGGKYSVVMSNSQKACVQTHFYYVTEHAANQEFLMLKSYVVSKGTYDEQAKAKIEETLTSPFFLVDLDNEDYILHSSRVASGLFLGIKNGDIADYQALIDACWQNVALETINNCDNAQCVEQKLILYYESLLQPIKDELADSDLMSNIAENLFNYRAKHGAFASVSSMINKYNEIKVLLMMKNIQLSSKITEIIENYAYLIGIDTSEYDKYGKTEVNKALKGKVFESLNEIKQAYNNRIKELKNKPGAPSGGSPSSGGKYVNYNNYVDNALVQSNNTNEYQAEDNIFADMEGYDWAIKSVTNLAKAGIISGMGDGRFEPSRDVKREEFIKMLVNALGLNSNGYHSSFKDVDKNMWYYSYISIAEGLGIVKGRADGSFGIGESITRQDMAVMVYRALEAAGARLLEASLQINFKDFEEISEYAAESIAVLYSNGIISGKGDNLFEPNSYANRAEAATLIFSLIGMEAN
jgi:acetolactate synthase small subunit